MLKTALDNDVLQGQPRLRRQGGPITKNKTHPINFFAE